MPKRKVKKEVFAEADTSVAALALPPRKYVGRMSPEDIAAALKMLCQQAEDYIESDISPSRAEAIRKYRGENVRPNDEGRSQVVMTTVRDVALATEPPILRLVFGAEPAVAFVPSRSELVDACDQQSAYITHLFRDAPEALLNVKAMLNDGLVQKTGFVKSWYEPITDSETYDQTALTREQVAVLENDSSCTYTITDQYLGEQGEDLYNCSVTKMGTGRICWAAVPPEEIIWNRSARSFETADFIAHRRDRTVGECVADGFDFDELVEYAKAIDRIDWSEENIARQEGTVGFKDDDELPDPSTWRIAHYECYARIDVDGDHIAELRQFDLFGPYVLLHRKDADQKELGRPVKSSRIHGWTPYPIPHTACGQSQADLTGDLQDIDTALIRGSMDSLSLALNSREAFQDGMVNVKDLMNTEVGAVIRTYGPPDQVLKEYNHRYVGESVFPLVQYFQNVAEQRTGHPRESSGLNPEAFQSSTETGVQGVMNAANARAEVLGRLFLEGCIVPLFRDLYDLTKQHQNIPAVVRMRGKFVPIDPRTWDDKAEVRVVLALGGGLTEQRLQRQQGILAKQEMLMQLLGPNNPMVDLHQYTSSLHKAIELTGDADPSRWITLISAEEAQQLKQQASQQPPKEDPADAVAKAQAEATLMQAQTAQQRLQLDMQKFQFEMQLEQERLRQEFALKTAELEMKYALNTKELEMQAFIAGQKRATDFVDNEADRRADLHAKAQAAHLDAQAKVMTAAIQSEAQVHKAEATAEGKSAQRSAAEEPRAD